MDTKPFALVAQFPILTHLHLRDASFDKFLDLLDVISSFPHLQSISLDNVVWKVNVPTDNSSVRARVLPPFIDRIRIRDSNLLQTLGWILSHLKLPRVSHFDVGPVDERTMPFTAKYISQLESHLTHLCLSFGHGEDGIRCLPADLPRFESDNANSTQLAMTMTPKTQHFGKTFGIATCRYLGFFHRLDTLRIDNFLDCTAHQQGTACFWAPRLIVCVQSNCIEHVIFGILLHRAGDLDRYNVNWQFFDAAFTSENYSRLKSIDFRVTGKVNIDGLAALMSLRLPKSADRDLLRFQAA